MRVVIDTDPGVDDALALLFALSSPELQLVAVTTVAGNVLVDQGARNARAILSIARADPALRVFTGAARPLVGRLTTATYFHGPGGLGTLELPDAPERAGTGAGADRLVRAAAESEEPLTVIALGPLTNLALACRLDPAWPGRLARIVAMGGAVAVPGNVTPAAEANFFADPEAAAIVLSCGAPVTLVGLDATRQARLAPSAWHELRKRLRWDTLAPWAHAAAALIDFYLTRTDNPAGPELHDPLAVAAACQPNLVTTRRLRVEVECLGQHTRGQSVAWIGGTRERLVDRGDYDEVVGLEPVEGGVDVCLGVDTERFLELFFGRLFGGTEAGF